MGTKLYVGNLAYSVREDQLHELFGEFGTVTSARIMVDDSGRPKGFGFVEMNSPEQAAAAIRGVTARYIDGQEELLPFEIDKICPRSIDNRYDSSSPTGC